MDKTLSILPDGAITAALLTAYAESKNDLHRGCSPGHCVHHDSPDTVAQTEREVEILSAAVKGSPEFQRHMKGHLAMTLQKMIERETIEGGMSAMAALCTYYAYVGWELAKAYLEQQSLERSA